MKVMDPSWEGRSWLVGEELEERHTGQSRGVYHRGTSTQIVEDRGANNEKMSSSKVSNEHLAKEFQGLREPPGSAR